MIYAAKQHFAQAFTGGPQSQEKARQILQDHGLDEDSEAMLESRWKRCSQRSWERAGGLIERVVYQCSCGYDHNARKHGRKRKIDGSESGASAIRHAPYNFTGCLAHADVTFIKSSRQALRIIGYLEHNDACRAAVLTRAPAVPLHPHVYEIAVRQLQQGAS
ncbi:hypothetical protein FOMPIDRAFT_1053897 [Fomitopsis schrenkii]|uniref:Uncharacterized protein n=1 Tax=Fomitopsis schrenkii TaxID=2126942 RepID=S8DR49_FOMSC|nr:hypothetical protein FOMPIDRAFT_1053897 [Fomitopsis schrenkii]